ncbi:MAG: SH3 domain-containing protein [Anaerolineae bacterium]
MLKLATLLLLITLTVTPVLAQDNCPALVLEAAALLDDACASTARNQLCYGHTLVTAATHDADLSFSQPGDILPLPDVVSLQTSGMLLPDVWGIALMRVQANLPDTLPGQNVTLLMFGDVELEDASLPSVRLPGTNTSLMNLRAGPSTNDAVITGVPANSALEIIGRNAAGDWVYALVGNLQGWLSAPLLTIDGDSSTLRVVADDYTPYGAMQAFYFRSGIGDSPCAEAPESGILLQAPDVSEPVQVRINDVDIQLGSTLYLQAQPDQAMTLYVLDGHAQVSAQQATQVVNAGEYTRIELDGERHAIGTPQPAQSFATEQFDALREIAPAIGSVLGDVSALDPDAEVTEAAPGGTIAGSWTSTDLDGSKQHLVISLAGDNQYAMQYTDEGASVCGVDANNQPIYPAEASATGALEGESITADFDFVCVGGGDPAPHVYTVVFTYDVETDSLTDSWGIIWSRG